MAERLSIEHFVGECALKCSQVILAARIPRQAGSNAASDKRSGRWFLLEVEDVPGLPRQLEPWRRDITQPLVLEVFATGGAGGDKLLELWTFRYGASTQPGTSSSSASRAGTSDDAAVYKRMILLVRSLHSYVRVLPSYRLFRAVKRQPAQPLGLAYRLTVQAQDGTTALLGGSAPASQATPQGLRGAFAFSPVETPGGLTMRVAVDYAPAGVAHMLLEATAAPAPASSAPRIIPDYVGGSGAPGERASVAAMAGGSSAGGSPACAHSAPGGRLLGGGGVPVPLGPLAGASPLGGTSTPLLAGSAGSGGACGAAFSGSPLQLPRAASLRPAPVVRQSWGSREVPAHVVHRGFATAPGAGPASPASSRHRRSSSGSGPAAPPAQPWGPGSAGAGASALGASPTTSLHHAPHAAAGRPPLPVPHSPISGAAGGGPSSASPTTPLSLPRPSPLQRSSSGGGPALFVASSPPTPQHAGRGSGALAAPGTSAPAHAGLPPSGHRTPHGASPHQSPHQLAPGRTRHSLHAHVLPRPMPGPTAPRPPAAPAAIMQGFEPRPAAPQPLDQEQQRSVPPGSVPIAGVRGKEGAADGDAPPLDASAGGLSTSAGEASDAAPQQGTAPSAPVAIPGRGSRGRARSVTDLTALGDAAAGAGGLSCAMGRDGPGAAAVGDGSSSAGAVGAASTTSVPGVGPSAGLLHRAGPSAGHLAMAPSSAPAAPRGMLGQLLAQGASSPLATCGVLGRVGALPRGSLLPGPTTGAASSGSEAAAGAGGSADVSASRGEEEEEAAAGAVMCPTAAVIVRPHAGPPFHRLSQVSAAGSRSPTGAPQPHPRHPRRIRSGECGAGGGDGSGPGSPMAAGPLSASPSLPFAFTPSGASVRSLVEQHRWGGGGGGGGAGPTLLPHFSLAAALPGLPGPSQLMTAQPPSPSPPVSGRDITALATIRRPSWSGRSVTLCAAAAVAVASASPSPRADPGDSGGGSERSLHLTAGLSVSPGGGDDLLAGALESDGGAATMGALNEAADASGSAAPGAAGGSGAEGHAGASRAAAPALQGGGAGCFGPEESEGDALPFALDSDTPLAIGGLLAAAPVGHAGRPAGGPGSQGGPAAGAALGSGPSRARDLSVCAFIRAMQDAPPLCSHWGWGGGAATVGDALLQVEQLAARLQPVLLQPPQ